LSKDYTGKPHYLFVYIYIHNLKEESSCAESCRAFCSPIQNI